MSLRQKAEALKQRIDGLLVAGGDAAILILRVVHVTADWCPPLKSATGSALFIFDETKKFKENKKEWVDLGQYAVDAVAEVVSAIESYDTSADSEGENLWVESATKLNDALQRIRSEIERRQGKAEKRPGLINVFSCLRDAGRIDDLKKDLDKALASFQLRTNLTTGVKLSAIEGGVDRLQGDTILGSLRYPHIAHDDSTQACLDGTRVDLTERIMTWCRNTGDSENRLMLLTAVAGAGKTSIALTIAERCEREATLLLRFFFREGEQPRPDFLFSGMARALADRDPVYRTFITSTLRNDPSLSTAPLTTQFKKLVASPLHRKPPFSDRPLVVIIDALDECDEGAFEPLAKILREEVPKLPPSIKFFVTSRHVDLVNRSLLRHVSIDHLTIDLTDATNVQDCAAYIRFQLQELKDWHSELRHNLHDEDKTVQEILERAGGLFIWVSTIFRYMKMANKDPMRTLESLLGTSAKRPKVPAERMIDLLYSSILKKCNWGDEDFVHDYPIVMGAIFVAKQPLSVAAWDTILSPFLKSSVRYAVAELAPLLSGVEDSYIPIRTLHQSFRNFIVDRIDPHSIDPGCNPVDLGVENARIALRCTEILNQDLGSVEGLGLIENISQRDEVPCIPLEKLPEHLYYACRHIVHHLSEVQEPSQELNGSVSTFLSQEAIPWVEVCVRTEGYISVSLLPEWVKLTVDHKSEDAAGALASVLAGLPENLVFFSRFQEAYEAANDSVVLCRNLVCVDSELCTPYLARSLNSTCIALSGLGRHLEALPFMEECVKLLRQLVAVNPGSYTHCLAMSLNNLYGAFAQLGRHAEALPFIEESTTLCRQLVVVRPGSFTPDLAMSLNNLSVALSALGRHSEALPFIEESVKFRRQLIAVHSDSGSCTPHLAMSLDYLYLALSNLGRHTEALPFIEESVTLYRQLVTIHPASHTPDLAMSLTYLCAALCNIGQHSDALPFIEESVTLHRQLVAVYPGLHTPNLALSLNDLYDALSKLGRHSEALRFIEEGVTLYRQLVVVNPGSYAPDLALSLNNLCLALSKLGRHSEALQFIEESIKIWRQLVAINQGAHTPGLARSLNNLYDTALSKLGRHSEALPFIEESIKLCRQPVAVNPGAHNPDLATSLNNLYDALSVLGRHSSALPFIEESVRIWRQLVAINPGAHTPDLAMSLNNLRNVLSNLGHHSEAQMVCI
ncbi:uncharacterized protein EI90DRAFT_3120104 [Cantharellus anzutake]|uniref:uncharacterized protein n=1 Tax=Cantharellus anzutake TaxID=1750568 RepID=UPI0019074D1C|nr:uncharacterized protein EI90DRAFT_3120104 [Cantharellus anzutake]KAF8335851.1 hypothetical protein EI90DRAFT_3120104 [Cantharellus anzutake]